MAISNGYCTLVELKSRLGISDATDDTALENVVTAVSRWIDEDRGRRIYSASGETRYYTAEDSSFVPVDDLLSLTSLATDEDGDGTYERTWASTDYHLEPYNAPLHSKPYTYISRSPLSNYTFPTVRKGIKLVGTFGFASTTPPAIKEACLLVSMRVFHRKDLLYGVSGSADLGTLQAIADLGSDGEVKALLNSVPKRILP